MKYLLFALIFLSFVPATKFELCDIHIKKNGVQLGQLLTFEVEEAGIRGYELGLCANVECSMVRTKSKIKSKGYGINTYKYYSKYRANYGYGLAVYKADGTLFAKRIILGYRTNK